MLGQAENIKITCTFTESNLYTCEIYEVVITHNETLNVVFVGTHRPKRTNNDVASVTFQRYPLNFLVSEVFTTFPNLQILFIIADGADSLEIRMDSFKHAKNLQHLQFLNAPTKVLPPNAFAGADKLTAFVMFPSDLEEINESAFTGLEKLVFSALHSLKVIHVTFAFIENIPARLFANNYLLEEVRLNRNNITTIGRNFISDLRNLKKLVLSENICTNHDWFNVTEQLAELHSTLEPCYGNYESTYCVDNGKPRHITFKVHGSLVIHDENGNELLRI